MFASSLSKLNSKQKQAVTFGRGPLLIVAGAGTGKTTVITNRIAYLIEKKKVRPKEILGLTFTDKAAQEMVERVDRLLSCGYSDLWISTFHSFCDRVLREHGLDIGLSTDFKLVDQTSAWLLIRQNLERFKLDYYRPLGQPTKFVHALIEHFNRCKDQQILPEDYLKYARKAKGDDRGRLLEVARAFQTYQELLLKSGVLDFGDLINYCLKLFQKRPKILEKYRRQFKYILVDEFQDTNFAQYELVRLLAAPENNLTVCGDDFQAIYRWRGASWGNLIQFKKDFPRAKEIALAENYRSFQNILDLAHKFIRLDDSLRPDWLNRISKKLKAARAGKAEIAHLHFKTAEQEIAGVVARIGRLLKTDKKACFNDFAILVRANNQAMPFARSFERSGVPYQFLALKGLYSKPVILDIISYFKFLDNYHESSASFRILSLPFLGISPQDIARINQYSRRRSKSIYEALQELPLIGGVSGKTQKTVIRILVLVEKHTRMALEKNVSEILLAFLEDSGFLEYLVRKERKEDLDLIFQFHSRIKAFEESHLDARLKSFMEELDMELESGEEGRLSFDIEQGPEAVKIMTVHSAKGLEFKYVFLINLVDKRFPSIERPDPIEIPKPLIKDILPKGDFHLQEERRLFYVGLTRARNALFLTSAESYGGVQAKRLSRFLPELGYDGKIISTKEISLKVERKAKPAKLELPKRFSFTQLIAFDKCPLQYKFAHILKIPVRGKAMFSFGKTMHNTLHSFALAFASGNKPGFKELLAIYEKEWLDEWYESPEQKKDYFESGKKTLKSFYEELMETKPKILLVSGKPALEQDFNLKIGSHTLIGKIDRIDDLDGGVEIIDYKTGSAKEKLRPEDKKQLLIYQMAAEEVLGLKPKKLTYYYLDEGKSVSFLGGKEDIKKEKEKIVKEIKEIQKSDFKPTPGWQCQWCDFKGICEYANKGPAP
ncbi:MAG: UvrD-helicase domain-containing protein [bacterium]|nr:UvrD-helicase domain-containing protein [bacterium]